MDATETDSALICNDFRHACGQMALRPLTANCVSCCESMDCDSKKAVKLSKSVTARKTDSFAPFSGNGGRLKRRKSASAKMPCHPRRRISSAPLSNRPRLPARIMSFSPRSWLSGSDPTAGAGCQRNLRFPVFVVACSGTAKHKQEVSILRGDATITAS